jgi:hypothetical protein
MWWRLSGLTLLAILIIAMLLTPIPALEVAVTLPPPGSTEPVAISDIDAREAALMATAAALLIALIVVVWLMVRAIQRHGRAS